MTHLILLKTEPRTQQPNFLLKSPLSYKLEHISLLNEQPNKHTAGKSKLLTSIKIISCAKCHFSPVRCWHGSDSTPNTTLYTIPRLQHKFRDRLTKWVSVCCQADSWFVCEKAWKWTGPQLGCDRMFQTTGVEAPFVFWSTRCSSCRLTRCQHIQYIHILLCNL